MRDRQLERRILASRRGARRAAFGLTHSIHYERGYPGAGQHRLRKPGSPCACSPQALPGPRPRRRRCHDRFAPARTSPTCWPSAPWLLPDDRQWRQRPCRGVPYRGRAAYITPSFDFNDRCLDTGAAFWVALATEFFNPAA
ncbi:hypothetical protein ACU4GD_38015 [Cupriavidus basilensis]